MCENKTVRMAMKRGSGVPTIPVSTDHRNGDWLATDVYEGEQYMDTDTGIVYTRNGGSIESVGGGGGATTINTTIVNIGDWDMDATSSVSIAHTVTDYTKIRSVDAMIIDDVSTELYKIDVAGRVDTIDATNISVIRNAGLLFDSTDFDATSFNRGYITITHID